MTISEATSERAKTRLKRLTIALTTGVSLASVMYFVFSAPSDKEREAKYMTVLVEKGILKPEINCSGTIKPRVEVQVGSQVSGTIKKLYAHLESVVKQGDVIALIDPNTYRAKVDIAKADVLSAKTELEKAEANLIDKLYTLRLKEGLINTKAISQEEFDTAQTDADSAQAEVDVAKATVGQMEADLGEAELNLTHTKIIAPVSGTVTAREMDVGQAVTPSFQAPVLFRIAENFKALEIYAIVDEADIGRVKEGQTASFTVPEFPGAFFTAYVTQIREDPKIQQNMVAYNVILDVNNDDLKLWPGMTASVRILVGEVRDAFMIPEQAFFFSPKERKYDLPVLKPDERRAWKLEANNRIRPIRVQVGMTGSERVQVFSDELVAGDQVVVGTVSVKKEEAPLTPHLEFPF